MLMQLDHYAEELLMEQHKVDLKESKMTQETISVTKKSVDKKKKKHEQ